MIYDVRIMNYDFSKLDNGVRVVLVPMAGVESVAVGVYVQTGSRYEEVKNNGISHFLEHMVFKGTKNYPSHTDTSRLEGMGAIQNAWTDVDATAYWCKIPADKWYEALDLLKDLVLYPNIPDKDLEIERGVIIEEINRREDRPDEIVGEVLLDQMYPENALGMTTLGTKEVISRVARQDFVQYRDRQYVSGRIVVVLAGKLEQIANSKKQIEDFFGSLPKQTGKVFEPILSRTASKTKIYKKDLASQVHIQMGVYGLTVNDPRRFALTLLTTYLGQGLSSRLFIELREKQGLCYAVATDEMRLTDTGVWSVYAGLAVDKLETAVDGIAKEIQRVKATKLTAEELIQTKEKIRGPMLFSKENPINVMNFYAKQALDKPDNMMDYDTVLSNILQIDADQIQQVANEILVNENLNLAVVGPVDEFRVQKLMEQVKI